MSRLLVLGICFLFFLSPMTVRRNGGFGLSMMATMGMMTLVTRSTTLLDWLYVELGFRRANRGGDGVAVVK